MCKDAKEQEELQGLKKYWDPEVLNIANEVRKLVAAKVNHAVTLRELDTIRFESLVQAIGTVHHKAEKHMETVKGMGLTAQLIDAEGYLRAVSDILAITQEEWLKLPEKTNKRV